MDRLHQLVAYLFAVVVVVSPAAFLLLYSTRSLAGVTG